MYASHLQEKDVLFESIYLDPNNPRFWDDRPLREVPDAKITDSNIQHRTKAAIDKFGIEELVRNILRNGFLPLDRIVVRPIAGSQDTFVVVEGNRRTRALQILQQRILDSLIDEDGIDDEYLSRLLESIRRITVLVYTGSETHDIAWVLQGVRHISGIRDWGPAQQARLIADRVENHGLSYTQVGQQFGLTPQKAGRLYRSYRALKQMFEDEEFQSKANNEYFSLFEEAIRSKDVKDWLGWDPGTNTFSNLNNLRQFYEWITPDDEGPSHSKNKRRIHDPRHIKKLGFLLAEKEHGLLAKLDQWEIPIEEAYQRASAVPSKYDWKEAIQEAGDLLSRIPQGAIKADAAAYLYEIDKLSELIGDLRKMASALIGDEQI